MSHSVTITRTTTSSTNTSYIVLNTGYLKTLPGLLKFLQLLCGIVCVGIFGYYFNSYQYFKRTVELNFMLMAVTFMIGTFLILLSCIISLSTGSIISKTIYEVIYHFFAGILLIIASLIVIIELTNYNSGTKVYNAYMAAGVIGLVNGILYLMSHSITVTRTTTTSTSYIVLNTGYLKSAPGILKLLQLLLGIACVGIFAYYYGNGSARYYMLASVEINFLLMATSFMIGTFLLLISCIVSLSTGTIISKSIYELVYHFFAGILLLIASLVVVIELRKVNSNQHTAYMTAGIMGIVNSVLYFISAFLANRSYRGI